LFQKRGVLRADGRRVFRDFRPAYAWLMAQMHKRVPGYGGGFPVWLRICPKPDMRRSAHLPRGTRGVRIEMELLAERVLLSDFETWHCVLNRWHLSSSWRESRDWDRRTANMNQFIGPLPPELERELQMPWERVFEFDLLRRSRLWGPINKIQGVTEYVRLEEVVAVREFVAR
jgi:hypothetical protein